ncbi:hypothetical protein [Pseudoalteromonas luteoviolacea]|uniref:Virulence factor membrane-bound polymerase C-terminal domain-containing protein n=1 Tax=Pseudoalteromonas luteoviolacea DSM 6061 TaxID=1365250 RepID=A0A166UE77_9GAMM|nr:hypothetical protein [Pseudoalteromonas luteoviolacea]KZN29866.1 hypothetical protein N475_25095 [Pseudoalteromonas luteoviolacea DSM 6061]
MMFSEIQGVLNVKDDLWCGEKSKWINLPNFFRAVFVLFSCAIAVISYDVFLDRFNTPKWFIFDLFIVVIISLAIFKKVEVKANALSVSFLLLSCYMLISSIWSPNFFEAILFTVRFVAFGFSIYLISVTFSKDDVLKMLVDGVFYASFVFCLVIIYQRYIALTPYSFINFSPIGFVNYLGQVLNIWIPILVLSIYMHRRSKLRLALGLFSLVILMNLLLESGTRGTILGLLCAEVFILAVMLIKTKKLPFKYMAISAGLLFSIATFSMLKEYGPNQLRDQVSSITALKTGRENVFANTIDMALDNPQGVGAGNFEFVHPKYGRMGTEHSSPYLSSHSMLLSPYNIILKFYSELGLVFGSLFTLLFFSLIFIAFRNFLIGNYIDVWVFLAVFSACFHAMFSSVFLTPVSLFFSLGLFSVVLSRSTLKMKSKTVSKPISLCLFLFVVLATAYLRGVELKSNYLSGLGSIKGDSELIEEAIELNEYNYFAMLMISKVYMYKDNDLHAALNSIERALVIYPYLVSGLVQATEISHQLGDVEKFNFYKGKVLAIYPNNERVNKLQ